MPRNLPVDKSVLKAAFCKGIPLTDLAKQYNINAATIRSMAVRGKWMEAKAKTDELLHQVAADAGIAHVAAIATEVKTRLAELSAFQFADKLDKLDIEGYTRALNTLDLMARRAHRLDEQQAKSTSLIQVNVDVNGASSSASSSVIDVDGEASTADETLKLMQ